MHLDDLKLPNRIILFDGVCNLCNRFVNTVMRRDPGGKFKMATLQSEIGQKILHEFGLPRENLNSVILIDNGKIWTKSDAIFRIIRHFKGLWRIASIFIVIPRVISDTAYNMIVWNRYRLFGRSNTCRLPSGEERDRFIE